MRFLLLLACLLLVVASGGLSLVLGWASYADLERMGQLLYLENQFARLPLALTATRYAGLHAVLSGGLLAGAGATWCLLRQSVYRQELRQLGGELRQAATHLRAAVGQLSRTEKTIGWGLLGLILGLRLGVLLSYGFRYDELASYLFFVREGPMVISSYYPVPNNHVFFNLCCSLLNPLLPDHPLLVMRLPSFLAAALGTGLSYVLLTYFSNFRVATLATGLFNLSPAGLLYAISGRGYYLQFVLIQLGFFAVVGLGSCRHYQRLGWLMLVMSSILGLYTIPTYAYPLASLLLGAALVLRPQPGQWKPLLAAAVLIVATSTLLYLPVGTVSGWERLAGNAYVTPLSWTGFRALALANIYEKIQEQFGVVRPVLLVGGALLALVPMVLVRMPLAPTQRSLGWVTWAMLVAPMAFVVAQRTYPPGRAVVYLAYFGFLLVAIAAWYAGARFWRGRRWSGVVQWGLISTCVLGMAALRFGSGVLARILSSHHEETELTEAWRWLAARQPDRVFLGSYQLFFYYYATRSPQALTLADAPQPGRRYPYLVLPANQQAAPTWTRPHSYRAVYRNDLVSIFALSSLR